MRVCTRLGVVIATAVLALVAVGVPAGAVSPVAWPEAARAQVVGQAPPEPAPAGGRKSDDRSVADEGKSPMSLGRDAMSVDSLVVSYPPGPHGPAPQDAVAGVRALSGGAAQEGEDIGFGFATLMLGESVPVAEAENLSRALVRSGVVQHAQPNYILTQPEAMTEIRAAAASGDTAATGHQPQAASVSPQAVQSAPPWGLDRIDQRSGLDGYYRYGSEGQGVTAYILDSGLRSTHQEFAGRVAPGAYAINDGRGTGDCNGHGTHVAGTVGGSTSGVAKKVTLIPVRVTDCASAGDTAGVIAGLNWIVSHHAYNTPAVLNISLGGRLDYALDAAATAAVRDNITVVVASGNDGKNACDYSPAGAAGTITVNAATYPDDDASWSNYGGCTNIYAPGDEITSAGHTSDLAMAVKSGTSMAAPHVTGAAARILSARPWLTPAQVWAELAATATDVNFLPSVPTDPKRYLYLPSPVAPVGSVFVPIDPVRVFDSRPSQGGAGALASGETRMVSVAHQIAWAGGARNVVPAGAVAVAYNVTVPGPAQGGHLRVMPGDQAATAASAVNFRPGETIANGLVAKVDFERQLRVYNAASVATDAIVDVVGYFVPSSQPGSRFTAITPTRVYDSAADPGGLLAAGGTRTVRVADQVAADGGKKDVVPAGASAVAYNITVVRPDGSGHLRVFPGDKASSAASTINWSTRGDVVANGLVVRISADRTIKVFNSAGAPVRFLVDIAGYYSASGALFYPIDPARAYDSRAAQPAKGSLGVGASQVLRTVSVADGRDGGGTVTAAGVVPAGASAVAYNLTVTGTGSPGHLRIFPAGLPLVGASAINWPGGGYTRANGHVVGVSADRKVALYNGSAAGADAIVDTLGYYK